MSLLKRKSKTVYVVPEFYKDWGNAGYELECLGKRLDAVREALVYLKDKPENDWAVGHWREAEAVLLRKWKHTIRLKETGLRQVQKADSGPKIDYNWWEGSEEAANIRIPILDGISNWLQDRVSTRSLDRAWEMARNESLQKARQGLG